MAKMVPEMPVEKGARGERRFYEYARDGLPESYTVFHSLPYVSAEERGIYEHEIDFLVVHRELGFLALEVKGGEEIRYLPRKRKWESVDARGRSYEIKDPFLQASRNIHWLVQEIVRRGVLDLEGSQFPFPFGHAVAFPDAAVSTRNFPPHALPELVIDREGLGDIARRIERIMLAFPREGKRPVSLEEYDRLCNRFLLPEFRVTLSIARRLEDEEAALVRLTEEQCSILDYLKRQKQALIQGYAGTGKTQLAVEKARRLAAEGLSVLLLCFNSPLASHLRAQFRPEDGRIDVYNYHDLAVRKAEEAGIHFRIPDSGDREERQRFWDLEVPRLLMSAAEALDLRYDAVIIDEGQDFRREWSESVLRLLKDGKEGCLYIFFDERQNIYRGELQFPIPGPLILLNKNCRNTRKICRLAECIGGIDHESYRYERNPEGEDVRFVAYDDPSEQVKIVEDIVSRLLKKGIAPGRITILSPRMREKSCLAGVEELAGCPVLEYREPLPQDALCFSTLKRFKGLESDVVIFCDMDGRFPIHDSKDQYVAVSRAKHLLFVVHDRRWTPPAADLDEDP